MKVILTKKNEQIFIDDEDFESLDKQWWHLNHE